MWGPSCAEVWVAHYAVPGSCRGGRLIEVPRAFPVHSTFARGASVIELGVSRVDGERERGLLQIQNRASVPETERHVKISGDERVRRYGDARLVRAGP